MKSRAWLLLAVLAPGLAGCAAVARVGVHFLYRKAELPAAQVVRDVCYMPGPNCDSNAHRLDLHLPAGRRVSASLGRDLGSQGIGSVVINYRLQPTTVWRGQVADARQAAPVGRGLE